MSHAQDGINSDDASGGSTARWWAGVSVGTVLAIPVGWVLSIAATLPFFLGPFFFAILGLIFGAVVHRVSSPSRPFEKGSLWLGTSFLVLTCWGTSIFIESRDFPINAASLAASKTRYLGGQSVADYRSDLAEGIRSYLTTHYPPGGTLGYVQWVITKGQITKGEVEGANRTLTTTQTGVRWVVRAVLSVVLLAFGIGSQTLALGLPYDPVVRAGDLPGDLS